MITVFERPSYAFCKANIVCLLALEENQVWGLLGFYKHGT